MNRLGLVIVVMLPLSLFASGFALAADDPPGRLWLFTTVGL